MSWLVGLALLFTPDAGPAMGPRDELSALIAEGPATEEERLEIARWRSACPHDSRGAPVFRLLGLLRLERVLGVDSWRPGLLGAVWCIEAGWSTKPVVWGDYRDGVPMAHGPFQLWVTSRSQCSLTREGAQDLAASARCWVALVDGLRGKAGRMCARGNLWMVAEAAVSNFRKYQWNCKSSSAHWKVASKGLPTP
jgi:hypothetical protein